MKSEAETESDRERYICPECSAEELGYFCRSCGALVRGDDRVLCPRCRQVVPAGDFCNQCGQGLGRVALSLKQLAMAGDTFWVTDEAPEPVSNQETALFPSVSSMDLAQAELPDWLRELSADSGPNEGQPRIYPALEPIRRGSTGSMQGQFVTAAILLLGLLLAGMMIMVALFLLRGGA